MKKNLSYVLIDNNKYDGSDPVDYNNLLKKVMDIETNDMENLDDPDMQQFAILTYEYEEYKKKELELIADYYSISKRKKKRWNPKSD